MFSGTRTIEMPSLIVPESGLSFGRSQRPSSKPGSAVGLTLMDGVIEEMIKCFNNGKILQLSLGEHPVGLHSI
jgi:RNA polymerase II elongation factor ELL